MDEKDKYTIEKLNRMINRIENEQYKNDVLEYYSALKLGLNCVKVKPRSIEGAVNALIKFLKLIDKRFIECNKNDFVNFISKMDLEGLSTATINTYGIWVKQYFTWLHREKNLIKNDEVPEICNWFKPKKTKKTLSNNDLLKPSEIQKMVDKCDNLRDKALISGLYDSACRIGEWVWIRIKDIEINPNFMIIKVSGKTGTRRVLLLNSHIHIQNWLNNHPFKDDQEAFLFCSFQHQSYGKKIHENSVGRMLKKYGKRACIKKHIHCHLTRHSKLSWLAEKEGMRERDLMLIAGWSSTEMCKTYLHHEQEDVFNKLKSNAGILEIEESVQDLKEKEALKPIVCPKCSNTNPSGALYCNCGACLSLKEAMSVDEKKKTAIDEAMNMFMDIASNPDRMKEYIKFKKTYS